MHPAFRRPALSTGVIAVGFRAFALAAVVLGAVLSAAGAHAAEPNSILAQLASHRAAYAMTFGQARTGTGTIGARGVMLIEFKDACDGWTTTQRVNLDLVNGEGDTVRTESNFTSWESKDGKSYRFAVKNVNGGKTGDEYQGTASLTSTGGTAVYETQNKRVPLKASTLFPTAHVAELIRRAESGAHSFFNTFFDGATPDGLQEVNVVIGKRIDPPAKAKSQLLARPSWPVHVAYFNVGDPKPDPDYEVGLRLYDNGVADAFVLDYGDFTVNANLEKIEPLPRQGC